MYKSILMASFVSKDELYTAIESISIGAKIDKSKIFIFVNEDNLDEYVLTYNMDSENANVKFTAIWKNTISIHRKKHTNTLYSLNAMNALIKLKNKGVVNKNYQVRWEDYSSKMLVIKKGKFGVIPIRLVKINF
jgi:hypothetical protein